MNEIDFKIIDVKIVNGVVETKSIYKDNLLRFNYKGSPSEAKELIYEFLKRLR